jgi:hypothetical protein
MRTIIGVVSRRNWRKTTVEVAAGALLVLAFAPGAHAATVSISK